MYNGIEYEPLRQNNLFSKIKRNTISNDTFTIIAVNVRSLSKHGDDIVSDDRKMNNNIIGFTET